MDIESLLEAPFKKSVPPANTVNPIPQDSKENGASEVQEVEVKKESSRSDKDRSSRDKKRRSHKHRHRSRSSSSSASESESESVDRRSKKNSKRHRSRSVSSSRNGGDSEKKSSRHKSRRHEKDRSSRRKHSKKSRRSSREKDEKSNGKRKSSPSRSGSVASSRSRSPVSDQELKKRRKAVEDSRPTDLETPPNSSTPTGQVVITEHKESRAPSVSGSQRSGSPKPTENSNEILFVEKRTGSPQRESRIEYDRPRDGRQSSYRYDEYSRETYRDYRRDDYYRRDYRSSRDEYEYRSRDGYRGRDDYDDRNRRDRRGDRRSSYERPRSPTPEKRPAWRPSPPPVELSEYERNRRTVFVMQLAKGLKNRELAEFFEKAGKVRDVRIVADKNSRRSKGVGYVEFAEESSITKAIELSGQKLMGIPVIVQYSEAEKNEVAVAKDQPQFVQEGELSSRLYVGSVHASITEDDLKQVFESFGEIETVTLQRDETGRSKGIAFIHYRRALDAKEARDKMNGFELGGRMIKVGLVTDKNSLPAGLNLDDGDVGFSLNSQTRVELMAQLMRSEAPTQTKTEAAPPKVVAPSIPPTRCILLSNMFNPADETEPDWTSELEEAVKEECEKIDNRKVLHISVDVESGIKGHIYLKMDSIKSAKGILSLMDGRYFGGKQISAQFLADAVYHVRFPFAARL